MQVDLTVVQVLLRLVCVAAYLLISILAIFNFIGMHNNTVDGNSFRLANPFSILDETQFNEVGNNYRRKFLKLWVVSVPLLFVTIAVFAI